MNLKTWMGTNRTGKHSRYTFAFIDEGAKREIRRKTLKAVAIPGYQVPFGSRDMPIARGWGTGGLQLTLSLIGPDDMLKVIDQGADDSVNAVNIKKFVAQVTGVAFTADTRKATLIQTRHRIPEDPLTESQILIFQVPIPEPLRDVEASERKTRRMHAEADYSGIWLHLYEDIVKFKEITISSRYPRAGQRPPYHGPKSHPPVGQSKAQHVRCAFSLRSGQRKTDLRHPPPYGGDPPGV